MKKIKVAAASLNQLPMDWQGNTSRIKRAFDEARNGQVAILALPELCLSGYGCEDMFLSPAVAQTAMDFLYELLPETHGLFTAVGLPVFVNNTVYNAVAVMNDGDLLGFVAKQNLAGDGVHYEPRWFKAWPPGERVNLVLNGKTYPFGDLIFELDGVKIGFEVCEDAWAVNRPAISHTARGVDVIINPSASHFAFEKQVVRQQLTVESSRAFNVTYLYANLLGNEAGRVIYDGDRMITQGGRLLGLGERFGYKDFYLTAAVIDLDLNRLNQAQSFSIQPDHNEQGIVRRTGAFTQIQERLSPELIFKAMCKEEEFTRAVALGLYDYMRKSYSKGFIVSLSGGADSAAVALLVDSMIKLALNELDQQGFLQKMHLPETIKTQEELQRNLLTCVYQASENSSETTLSAAEGLAVEMNAEFHNWQISPLVKTYTEMLEQTIERPLSWEQDDLALQNIQARVRAPGVWMLANIKGALLLATSNRSEAAVGYATMDGDTCGGLSPIAGIDKQFLLHWLVWMEEGRFTELEPLLSLRAINVQRPTAELRPQDENQTDEDDLMPYAVLDAIEAFAIRDKMGPKDILSLLVDEFEYKKDQLTLWVDRFFKLWCRNQWKRERYAPSFHLDDKNLDPKTWCRFPILNSGFRFELASMN